MSYTLTVSPDFNTKYLPGWFIFNTWLQKRLKLPIHFEVFNDFASCHAAIKSGKIDLIYANPADGALLLREHGFLPVAHPIHKPDEALIAVASDSPVQKIEDFQPGLTVAVSDDPEVNMIGRILLEPADIQPQDINYHRCNNYIGIVKAMLDHKVDAGFFLAETFSELSGTIRNRLRVILRSQIHVIHHLFLAGPRMQEHVANLQNILVAMNETAPAILRDIDIGAWRVTDQEEAEFMVDLVDTLTI